MTRMKSFYKLTGISLVIIVFYVSLMLGSSELGGEVATLLRPEQDGSIKKIMIHSSLVRDTDKIPMADIFTIKEKNIYEGYPRNSCE